MKADVSTFDALGASERGREYGALLVNAN